MVQKNNHDKYLEETLLQAKKHGLPIHHIKELEIESKRRFEIKKGSV